ncbi:Serine/threonine-protein phosphatase 4 catalytic subunit [Trichinella spiralis]|uniref:Serine/threonine-protein phosphatase 4 catalytic subunit n=1 Tax=Trichinella spiralis TaxID=6334 RepID=A0ABR3KRE5_TRISP
MLQVEAFQEISNVAQTAYSIVDKFKIIQIDSLDANFVQTTYSIVDVDTAIVFHEAEGCEKDLHIFMANLTKLMRVSIAAAVATAFNFLSSNALTINSLFCVA